MELGGVALLNSDTSAHEFDVRIEKEIHHGWLYPNLDTLVDKGLVKKSQRDRRTNQYTVTRRASRELEARTEWETQYIGH